MKSLIAVATIFVLTVAVGVSGKPSAMATEQAVSNAKTAKQPFVLAERSKA